MVQKEIRKAKRIYKNKAEYKYSSGDLQAGWKGIKSMSSITQRSDSDRKPLKIDGANDLDLPNVCFYSRIERHDFSENISSLSLFILNVVSWLDGSVLQIL